MNQSFGESRLDPVLIKAVKDAFQIEAPSDIQARVIPAMMENPKSDIMIRSKTGSGKTLAFLLPILHRLLEGRRTKVDNATGGARSMGTKAIVVVPTRELAAQTSLTLNGLLSKLHGRDHWIVSCLLSGGDRRKSEKERLRKGVHIVVGTPGRLLDHLNNTEKWTNQVALSCDWIILDEADRLLDSGFEKTIKEILEKVRGGRVSPALPQVVLCSATVDGAKRDIFGYQLQNPLLVESKAKDHEKTKKDPNRSQSTSESAELSSTSSPSSLPNPNLEHFYLATPTKFRLSVLVGLLRQIFSSSSQEKVVLFTICCDTVDYLYSLFQSPNLSLLSKSSAKVSKLHGNLEHKARLDTFTSFSLEKGNCLLVCTDIASRGLNLSHVTCIIQYDAPCDINDYVHRAGRTARQEERGKSILFLMPSERDYLTALEKKALSVNQMKWWPLAELFLKNVKLNVKKTSLEAEDDEEEHDQVADVSLELRRRNFAWLDQCQTSVKQLSDLFAAAKLAYLSFIRAYATHPSAEKSIFHIKKLHLGHLAATFLLAEAPTAVAAHSFKKEVDAKTGDKMKKTPMTSEARREKYQKPLKMKGPASLKPKRIISEFDAGDLNETFMMPRKKGKS